VSLEMVSQFDMLPIPSFSNSLDDFGVILETSTLIQLLVSMMLIIQLWEL
jgi:hypothetical protein